MVEIIDVCDVRKKRKKITMENIRRWEILTYEMLGKREKILGEAREWEINFRKVIKD